MKTNMNKIDDEIVKLMSRLYNLLLQVETIEAEECLGLIAEAQAIYFDEVN
jgi:hypothetical protein